MRRAFFVPVALLVSLGVAGCSVDATEPETAKTTAPIINGVFDDGTTNDSVVLIETELSGGMAAGCTGTLVAPNVVFTARHCVSTTDDRTKAVGADYDPAKMNIWFGNSPAGFPDAHVQKIVHDTATNLYNSDFAILILKEHLTKPISPIRLASPPIKYENVTAVGYGITTSDSGTPTTLHKRYRRDGLKIQVVGPVSSYGIGDREMVLGESICSGDSGGPLLDASTRAVLGVVSRGGNGTAPSATKPWAGCVGSSTMNIYTRLDGYAALIKSAMAEAGATPWEEGAPKPEPPPGPTPPPPGSLGADCTGPGDCASKLCVSWSGKQVCSQACSDASPCPTGFDCLGGYCIQQDPTAPPDPPPDPVPTPDPAADPPADTTTAKKGCSLSAVTGEGDDTAPGLVLGSLALGLALSARRRRSVARRLPR